LRFHFVRVASLPDLASRADYLAFQQGLRRRVPRHTWWRMRAVHELVRANDALLGAGPARGHPSRRLLPLEHLRQVRRWPWPMHFTLHWGFERTRPRYAFDAGSCAASSREEL